MTIKFRFIVIALLLITFNVQAQEDQKITTVEWQCYSPLDYRKGEIYKSYSGLKVLARISHHSIE